MEITKALAIFTDGPVPNAVLQIDHICVERLSHALNRCIMPENKVYTLWDAGLDTPESLRRRLAEGGSIRPAT
jgi:hypothetical protein